MATLIIENATRVLQSAYAIVYVCKVCNLAAIWQGSVYVPIFLMRKVVAIVHTLLVPNFNLTHIQHLIGQFLYRHLTNCCPNQGWGMSTL
jgi:hypothetical protein